MSKFSDGYQQLAGIFQNLENARFEAEKDFGANVTDCFSWFLSPSAAMFLEKREVEPWLKLKENKQFKWKFQKWSGQAGEGIDIKLNL